MKSFMTLITAVTLIGIHTSAYDGYPKLVFEGKRILDIGAVQQGDTVKCSFVIRNEGNALLKIDNINKSCNCTDAMLSKYELQPQDTATLTLTINTVGKIGTTSITTVVETNTLEQEHVIRLLMNVTK